MQERDDGASPAGAVGRVTRAIGDRLAWLFLIAAALTCYEVFVSYALRAPTIWVHDTAIMLCSTCFLFGGAYALEHKEHIRITIVYDLMPQAVRRLLDHLAILVCLVYMLALSWFAGAQTFESIRIWEMSGRAWDFPMPVVIRTAFFGGSALLALEAAAQLVVATLMRRSS